MELFSILKIVMRDFRYLPITQYRVVACVLLALASLVLPFTILGNIVERWYE